jgi:type IV secretion system protein VirD4
VERSSASGGELLIVALGGLALLGGGVVWTGAALAAVISGVEFKASLADALAAVALLGSNAADPVAAWPTGSGLQAVGAPLYWVCTALCVGSALTIVVALLRLWNRSRVGTVPRKPLGVDARARFARARDLKPLIVGRPEPGRFILGRFGRHLLASEHRPGSEARRRRRPSTDARAGDRGAIALVGPSRSGKTTAVVSGILEWDGPAVLSSVKDDLLRVTAGHRGELGDVAIFDPTQSTGLGTAVWSPLRQAGTTMGAQRAARALVEAAPRGSNVDGGVDFWMAQAEMLLASLLFAAHHTGRDMGVVAEWVMTQDRPGEWGPGEVKDALDQVMMDGSPIEQVAAHDAARSLLSLWDDDERTRSSVYATARTVVWPWAEPGMAASSRGESVDLDWLLAGPNTLYLCSPIEDQARLAPAFGGFLNDIIKQIYLRVASTGRPLDPPLLVVIDEAGNTPLKPLPEYASTLAGLGVLLVTVWQSLAQIEATYGRQTGTILSNHLSKLFYAGLSDPDSMRYVASVLGDEEVETSSRTHDMNGGRASRQLATSRNPLAAPHVLRQMIPGDALLVHGTLPPAHVRTRPYYRERTLRRRAAVPVPARPTERPSAVMEVTTDAAAN